MALFLQQNITIVSDNAKSHPLSVSQTAVSQHCEIPALCHFGSLPKNSNKPQRRTRSKSIPSRKTKTKRSESFPPVDKCRWESMSLLSAKAASMATAQQQTCGSALTPLRRHSSDDIFGIDTTSDFDIMTFPVDCQPRQPRRESSSRTITLLDEALDVINSLEIGTLEQQQQCPTTLASSI